MTSRAAALMLACHPLPSVAVTAISAGLVALAGVPIGIGVVVVAAIAAGQLSIGWSNDAIDAGRDRTAGRSDKPVGRGDIGAGTVWIAAVGALAVTVALSLVLGPGPGGVAIAVVLSGWAYNLGVKATVVSFVPYVIAFGALPAAATLALPGAPWPAPWAMISGALLGVAIHLFNVLPDLEDDVRTNVRGLPHRIGRRATAVLGPVLLVVATAVIVTGPPGSPAGWEWIAAVVVAVLAATAVRSGLVDPRNRWLFVAAVAVAGVDVILFALSGASLVSG